MLTAPATSKTRLSSNRIYWARIRSVARLLFEQRADGQVVVNLDSSAARIAYLERRVQELEQEKIQVRPCRAYLPAGMSVGGDLTRPAGGRAQHLG